MISEFLFERGKKKWSKNIKNKERKKRKMPKRKGENKTRHLSNFFIFPLFLLALFLLYSYFISLNLLYFWSRSCNGFTPLCSNWNILIRFWLLNYNNCKEKKIIIKKKSCLFEFSQNSKNFANQFFLYRNRFNSFLFFFLCRKFLAKRYG